MGNSLKENAVESFQLWINGVLMSVRDKLNAKYPPPQPALIKPDRKEINELKQQIKADLTRDVSEDVLSKLKKELRYLVNETEKNLVDEIRSLDLQELLKKSSQTEQTDAESAEASSLIDSTINTSSDDENPLFSETEDEDSDLLETTEELSRRNESIHKRAANLTIIKNATSLKNNLSDEASDDEVAQAIISQLKQSLAPNLYRKLDTILAEESKGSIQMLIPSVSDRFQVNKHERSSSKKGNTSSRNTISKLIRPGIMVNSEVVTKAKVEVWT